MGSMFTRVGLLAVLAFADVGATLAQDSVVVQNAPGADPRPIVESAVQILTPEVDTWVTSRSAGTA